MTKLLLTLLLSISLLACTQQKTPTPTKLLLSIEERNIQDDIITRYDFFSDKLVTKVVLHSTSPSSTLFESVSTKLSDPDFKKLQTKLTELQNLEYQNYFPWHDKLYERGNVYKITFAKNQPIKFIKANDSKASVLIAQSYFYYAGHKDSPVLFKELVNFAL